VASEIESADDYLRHVRDALNEATREIDTAATISLPDDEAKEYLGRALGQARNALTRAQRDLAAHIARQTRRVDQNAAEAYFRNLRLTEDPHSQIVVAVVPLPLEEERVPLELMIQRSFQNDFTNWVTRFNNEERRTSRLPYLMDVPGGLSPVVEDGRFHFLSHPQGSKEPSQTATLDPSGAFLYKQRLYSWQTPPKYTIELVLAAVQSTINFVWRLYEELAITPRAFGVQSALVNVGDFHLMIPFQLGGFTEFLPKEGVGSIAAPERPIVVPFGAQQSALDRVVPRTETAIRAHYRQ
jgi:hypothetical protein